MLYFTGSKAHNVRIREMAVRAGPEALRVRAVRREDGRPARRRDRGGGLRAARPAVHRADAAGGPRRGRGGARRRAARPRQLERLRGDLHTHTEPHRRAGPAGGDARGSGRDARYAYYAVTDHAPNLAMQRMTDEKMLAQREQAARAAGATRDGAAARHRAQHRPGRRRGLGRRTSWPGSTSPWPRSTRTSTSRARR